MTDASFDFDAPATPEIMHGINQRQQSHAQLLEPAQNIPAMGVGDRVKIIVDSGDDMPPTGWAIGHNGRNWIIRPNEPVMVPRFLLEVMDNAVVQVTETDPISRRPVRHYNRKRINYRLVA